MPGFRWEMVHDLALAKEVATRPEKSVDQIEIADILNSAFSTGETSATEGEGMQRQNGLAPQELQR